MKYTACSCKNICNFRLPPRSRWECS